MIRIGEYQVLTIAREMPQGFYLEDKDGDEVLMPRAFMTEEMNLDDEVEVFIYCDSEDMDIATTEKPYLTVGQFAYLHVNDVNEMGAFCDWGVSKELLIPFRNQAYRLAPGGSCIVHLYLDESTDRLVGTTRLRGFLKQTADEDLSMGQEVDLLISSETDLGYSVIINQKYAGLVYEDETHKALNMGEQLKGYIKPIRIDGKIDVSIFPLGVQSIEPTAQKILDKLKQSGGFLPYTDKSDPDHIREIFGVSKKLFKKSIGSLYKQKLVILKKDGIYIT